MSVVDYKGWRVPSEIIIVSKECMRWENGKYYPDGTYQGYVVDPSSKTMLESAKDWARWIEYKDYDPVVKNYKEKIVREGTVYKFSNNGFKLELLQSAAGSSQGGKLSFWNCKISKDDHEFIIGINSEYLLEILLYNDFKQGVCQSELSFARCKGGVGMLNGAMPSYQQFLQDEKQRAAVKKGKTKKREQGHLYNTLTEGDVYFGTYYRWYEPVFNEVSRAGLYNPKTLVGFKKLTTPIVQYWHAYYDKSFTKKSEYLKRNVYFNTTIPARTDSGLVAEVDITDEEVIEYQLKKVFNKDVPKWQGLYSYTEYIGLSTSNTEYELPDWVREFIIERGYKVFD